MYEVTIKVKEGGKVVGSIGLKTEKRSLARGVVELALENSDTIEAVATKATEPRVVKFKGL